MNCSQHSENPAVASCGSCGRGLCPVCADAYTPPMCAGCATAIITAEKGALIKQLVVSAILLVPGAMFGNAITSSPGAQLQDPAWVYVALMAYLFAGTPYGWRALSAITPRVFLIMPVMGWVFYFVFKLSASAMVGCFVTPFKVWSAIRALRTTE